MPANQLAFEDNTLDTEQKINLTKDNTKITMNHLD